mgnify:CR=1 FL=1
MNGGNTLVLNADAQPLSVVPLSVLPWQEAIRLVFVDRVDVLAEYEDWPVRSPSVTMQVPTVVMLRDYVKVERGIKFSRYNVLLRDLFTCQYCNHEFPPHLLTIDHVVPRFRGGKTKWNNVVAACEHCNMKKAHFMEMQPNIKPIKPDYWHMVGKRKKFPIAVPHDSWREFIDWPGDLVVVK